MQMRVSNKTIGGEKGNLTPGLRIGREAAAVGCGRWSGSDQVGGFTLVELW